MSHEASSISTSTRFFLTIFRNVAKLNNRTTSWCMLSLWIWTIFCVCVCVGNRFPPLNGWLRAKFLRRKFQLALDAVVAVVAWCCRQPLMLLASIFCYFFFLFFGCLPDFKITMCRTEGRPWAHKQQFNYVFEEWIKTREKEKKKRMKNLCMQSVNSRYYRGVASSILPFSSVGTSRLLCMAPANFIKVYRVTFPAANYNLLCVCVREMFKM